MKIKTFIEKAVDGGYYKKIDSEFDLKTYLNNLPNYAKNQIWLDPKAWEAVGKVEGWGDVESGYRESDGLILYIDGYKSEMYKMMEHIIAGGTPESFIKTL